MGRSSSEQLRAARVTAQWVGRGGRQTHHSHVQRTFYLSPVLLVHPANKGPRRWVLVACLFQYILTPEFVRGAYVHRISIFKKHLLHSLSQNTHISLKFSPGKLLKHTIKISKKEIRVCLTSFTPILLFYIKLVFDS